LPEAVLGKADCFVGRIPISMRKLKDLAHFLLYSLGAKYMTPAGCERIYFHHIPKTAGTALTNMFLEAAARRKAHVDCRVLRVVGDGGQHKSNGQLRICSPAWVVRRLPASRSEDGMTLLDDVWGGHRHRVAVNGLVFQTGDKSHIEAGKYFYAWSHIPAHDLRLPDNTLKITILRNPLSRVLSHYRMLLDAKAAGNWKVLDQSDQLLGGSFGEFLSRVPPERLMQQIHHFSPTFDPEEAYERVRECHCCLLTEGLAASLQSLSGLVGLELVPLWANRSSARPFIRPKDIGKLREMIDPCVRLYNKVAKDQDSRLAVR